MTSTSPMAKTALDGNVAGGARDPGAPASTSHPPAHAGAAAHAGPAAHAGRYGPAVLRTEPQGTIHQGTTKERPPASLIALREVTISRAAIEFWPEAPPGAPGRALPWTSVRTVTVVAATPSPGTDAPPGSRLRLTTDAYCYDIELPAATAADLAADLAPLAPVALPPAAPASATDDRVRPDEAHRPAPHPSPSATTFERIRPLLRVVLVVAVATMAALVLAASTGAIHLAWLGGTGATARLPLPGH